MYFAHVLGAEILGIYFIYIATFNLIIMFMDVGLSSGTIKRISEGRDTSEFFTASFLIYSATSIICIIILYILRHHINDYIGAEVWYFLVLSLFLMRYTTLIRSTLFGEKKTGISYIINLAEQIVKIIFQVLLVAFGYQLYGLIGGFCIALFVNIPLGLKFIDVKLKRPSLDHVKSIFAYSKYAFGVGINEYLYQSMDILVIGLLLPKFYSGIYGASWSFSGAAVLGTIAISSTLFPYISEWSANGQIDHIKNAFSEALTYSLILAIPIFAGVLVFSKDLLYFAYGETFSMAWITLIVLTGARLIETVQMITRGALAGMNRPDLVLKITCVTIPLNLIGNFVLVYTIGMIGAAIATLVTIIVSLKLSLKYAEGTVPISIPWNEIKDESISALVMISVIFVGLHFAPVNSFAILGAYTISGAAIYFTTLLAINEKIRGKMTSLIRGMISNFL
ncbi:MAG TPA: oligosaccharide flippase family protein [Methanotrichaceae archaeon]|nr:oligosaccharide flippase family protein [Methanotrichaceae archaeon]